jgi:hypothetical protein
VKRTGYFMWCRDPLAPDAVVYRVHVEPEGKPLRACRSCGLFVSRETARAHALLHGVHVPAGAKEESEP